MNWEQEEKEVSRIASDLDHLEKTVSREKLECKQAESHLKCTQDAQEIIQHLAQAVQQKAHAKISEVVSSCLASVFPDDPYSFQIRFERKRGRTEAVLLFERNGLVVDPITSTGGGVVDIAAFALRVACLMLHRPRLSKVVFLDEPFRFVSHQYQDGVRAMLESLSKDMGLQIVQVTHVDALAVGKIIEL